MRRKGQFWNYFCNVDDVAKKAECIYCKKCLSFRTTVSNLKNHLKQKHIIVYEEMCNIARNTNANDDESEDAALSSMQDVSSFFLRKQGGLASCDVCGHTVPYSHRGMISHLKEEHPKLLDTVHVDDEASAVVSSKDSPTTGEVAASSTEKWKIKMNRNEEIKRRLSDSSDEPIIRKKTRHCYGRSSQENADDDEIDKFWTYVTSLLKDLREVTSIKLQRDFINSIMNAKLEILHSRAENKMF